MGVPVLTWPGRSFAARVCASLVNAAGIPELAVSTPDEYVARAVELAQSPEKLAAIKARLAANRERCLLFDTPRLVSGLEDLYRQMWRDYTNGELPVPDMRNLDLYHEVGLELDVEAAETLSDEAYLAQYQEKLSEWDAAYPIAPDSRLWSGKRTAAKKKIARAVA